MQQITLSNVCKTYNLNGRKIPVIKNASLEINQGDFVVILGPSGSGKTTLLHMIAGIDKPTSGLIMIGDQEITTLSQANLSKWLSKNVGIVFQSYNLMPYMSAMDNVALPLIFSKTKRRLRLQKASALLRMVGLKDRYDQQINLLSGGEQQRVAIARALVNNPQILIADEPTGDLDLANAAEVMEIIYSLYKTRSVTIVMSTHNANYSKYADKIIYIEKGEVIIQKGINGAR